MEMVFMRESEPKTTSIAIADGTGVQHKNILGLVKRYSDDLCEFGLIAFETRFNKQGRPTEYGLLNEPQATLLLTYKTFGFGIQKSGGRPVI